MRTKTNLKIILSLTLILFLIVPLISSFTATISNPRMVLYDNITQGEIITIQDSVIAVNDNDHDTNIIIKPLGVWKNKIKVTEENFTLKAWEQKEVFYTIIIDKAGAYVGDILVTFERPNSTDQLSLVQELEVYVKSQDKGIKITGSAIGVRDSDFLGIFVIAIIILVMILIIIKVIKFDKKKK